MFLTFAIVLIVLWAAGALAVSSVSDPSTLVLLLATASVAWHALAWEAIDSGVTFAFFWKRRNWRPITHA